MASIVRSQFPFCPSALSFQPGHTLGIVLPGPIQAVIRALGPCLEEPESLLWSWEDWRPKGGATSRWH